MCATSVKSTTYQSEIVQNNMSSNDLLALFDNEFGAIQLSSFGQIEISDYLNRNNENLNDLGNDDWMDCLLLDPPSERRIQTSEQQSEQRSEPDITISDEVMAALSTINFDSLLQGENDDSTRTYVFPGNGDTGTQREFDVSFSPPKAYHCKLCTKAFYNDNARRRHQIRHAEKLLRCPYCGQRLWTTLGLQRHFNYHHRPGRVPHFIH